MHSTRTLFHSHPSQTLYHLIPSPYKPTSQIAFSHHHRHGDELSPISIFSPCTSLPIYNPSRILLPSIPFSNRNNPLFNPATLPFHPPSSSHPLYNSTHTNTPTPQLPTLHPFSTFHPIHITFSSSIQHSASHTPTQSLHSLFTSSQSLSYTPSIYSLSKQSNAPTSHPFQIPL